MARPLLKSMFFLCSYAFRLCTGVGTCSWGAITCLVMDEYRRKPQRAGTDLVFCVKPDVPPSSRLERSILDLYGEHQHRCAPASLVLCTAFSPKRLPYFHGAGRPGLGYCRGHSSGSVIRSWNTLRLVSRTFSPDDACTKELGLCSSRVRQLQLGTRFAVRRLGWATAREQSVGGSHLLMH